jgi:hypothetical protein
MLHKKTSAFLFIPALALLLPPTACKPVDECRTAYGPFAAKFILQGMPTGTCTAAQSAELTKLKGDTLGFSWYEQDHFHRNAKTDQNSLAVQSNTIGTAVNTYGARGAKDAMHKPYGLGTFTTAGPDTNDMCAVDTLSAGEIDLPMVAAVPPDPKKMGDKGQPELPALSLKYEFSNLHVIDDAIVSGGEISADLTFTKNGCSAQYKVVAVYPNVPCLDKDKNPQNVLCDPNPQPDQGHPVGSGLHFPTHCDADLGFCVLDGDTIP